MQRREFLKSSGILAGTAVIGASKLIAMNKTLMSTKMKSIKIKSVNANFEREPLIRPFGFKGGFMSEIWQTAAQMESESGYRRLLAKNRIQVFPDRG